VQPHRECPQRQTEHHARRNQFEHIDGVDAGKSRPVHNYCERDYSEDQWENDVSPRRAAIRHVKRGVSFMNERVARDIQL
jgi:hypothetical protein